MVDFESKEKERTLISSHFQIETNDVSISIHHPFIQSISIIKDGFVDAIGNTPLIFLKGPSERTGCKIFGKAEFLNPGGSVKVS